MNLSQSLFSWTELQMFVRKTSFSKSCLSFLHCFIRTFENLRNWLKFVVQFSQVDLKTQLEFKSWGMNSRSIGTKQIDIAIQSSNLDSIVLWHTTKIQWKFVKRLRKIRTKWIKWARLLQNRKTKTYNKQISIHYLIINHYFPHCGTC